MPVFTFVAEVTFASIYNFSTCRHLKINLSLIDSLHSHLYSCFAFHSYFLSCIDFSLSVLSVFVLYCSVLHTHLRFVIFNTHPHNCKNKTVTFIGSRINESLVVTIFFLVLFPNLSHTFSLKTFPLWFSGFYSLFLYICAFYIAKTSPV